MTCAATPKASAVVAGPDRCRRWGRATNPPLSLVVAWGTSGFACAAGRGGVTVATEDLKSSARKRVRVRVPPPAPTATRDSGRGLRSSVRYQGRLQARAGVIAQRAASEVPLLQRATTRPVAPQSTAGAPAPASIDPLICDPLLSGLPFLKVHRLWDYPLARTEGTLLASTCPFSGAIALTSRHRIGRIANQDGRSWSHTTGRK